MSNPLEAIWNLFFSPDAAAEYKENPQEYIDENGLGQCDPAEINELVALAFEKGPVNQGATVGAGGNQSVGGSSQSGGWSGGGGGGAAPPPPPPLDPNLPPAEALEQTINYYITNNTTTNVDDRDTNVDSSVNTTVVTDEGDVTLGDIDTETTTAS